MAQLLLGLLYVPVVTVSAYCKDLSYLSSGLRLSALSFAKTEVSLMAVARFHVTFHENRSEHSFA